MLRHDPKIDWGFQRQPSSEGNGGGVRSGWCSAVIYSIVGTCRLLGVNPEAYLTWVLPKLAAATNRTATALLPHDYAREHPPDSG